MLSPTRAPLSRGLLWGDRHPLNQSSDKHLFFWDGFFISQASAPSFFNDRPVVLSSHANASPTDA